MGAVVYPVDAVAGSPSYTGRMLRNAGVSPLLGGATTARPLGGFSGIRPGTPSSIVTVSSTTWTVTPFGGTLDGEAAAIAGVYNYAFNTNQTGSITAASGSARIDRLDVQVSDPAEGDGTSTPGIAIVYTLGTAGSGSAPSAPARSHVLCYINVPASGGGSPTVTFNAPFTVAAGGILPTSGAAAYPASPSVGQYVDDATLGLVRYNGTAWVAVGSVAIAAIIPTAVNTGGTVSVNSTTGAVTGSGSITALRINSSTAVLSQYSYVEMILQYDASTSGSHTLNMALGSTLDTTSAYVTAGSYTTTSGSPTSTVTSTTTAWTNGYSGNRNKRRIIFQFTNWAVASETFFTAQSIETNVGANLLQNTYGGEHNVATAFDGINIAFSTVGTISNLLVKLVGHL